MSRYWQSSHDGRLDMRKLPVGLLVALLVALLLALSLFATPVQAQPGERPAAVLFVGNSQIYVGNLPAVFDALSDAAGGAKHYDFVVLQERGGDLVCAFAPESCAESAAAIAELGRLARAHRAKPVLLGTYQKLPRASDVVGFRVDAPMYEPSAHFLPASPITSGLEGPEISVGHDYGARRVGEILAIASGA